MVGFASWNVATRPLLLGNVTAFASAFAWATSFPATEILLASWHPLPLTAARIGGAGLFLLVLLLLSRARHELRVAPWPDVVLVGTVGVAVAPLLLVTAQAWSDPVTVAVLATTAPAISAAVTAVETRERPPATVLAGILLAVLGGIFVSVHPFREEIGFRGGEPLMLVSLACWVWYSRAAVERLQGLSDLSKAALTTAAGGVVLLGVVGAVTVVGFGPFPVDWRPVNTLALAWTAFVAVGLSIVLWMSAVRLLGVTVASMHLNLAPFYVMLLAWASGATVDRGQLLGAALVALGVALSQRPGRRALVAAESRPPAEGRGGTSSAVAAPREEPAEARA